MIKQDERKRLVRVVRAIIIKKAMEKMRAGVERVAVVFLKGFCCACRGATVAFKKFHKLVGIAKDDR